MLALFPLSFLVSPLILGWSSAISRAVKQRPSRSLRTTTASPCSGSASRPTVSTTPTPRGPRTHRSRLRRRRAAIPGGRTVRLYGCRPSRRVRCRLGSILVRRWSNLPLPLVGLSVWAGRSDWAGRLSDDSAQGGGRRQFLNVPC